MPSGDAIHPSQLSHEALKRFEQRYPAATATPKSRCRRAGPRAHRLRMQDTQMNRRPPRGDHHRLSPSRTYREHKANNPGDRPRTSSRYWPGDVVNILTVGVGKAEIVPVIAAFVVDRLHQDGNGGIRHQLRLMCRWIILQQLRRQPRSIDQHPDQAEGLRTRQGSRRRSCEGFFRINMNIQVLHLGGQARALLAAIDVERGFSTCCYS